MIVVDDIRPKSVMVGQKAAVATDIEWLKARKARFERVACPACEADDAVPLFEKNGVDHVRCRKCATQYVNPRPTAELLHAFYVNSANYAYWAKHIYPTTAGVRREKLFAPRARIIAELARSRGIAGGPIAEVGAAYGWFCEEVRRTGAFREIIAIEPTPDLAEVCRQKGLTVIEDSYENADLGLACNVIAAFEVIEHLHEPRRFIQWCRRNLTDGGCIYLSCPNILGFETLMLGRNSGTVDHQHLNLFNPQSIAQMIEREGFRDVTVKTPGELDVNIVKEALESGSLSATQVGPFLERLLAGPQQMLDQFQQFLKCAGLSTHMSVVAFKA